MFRTGGFRRVADMIIRRVTDARTLGLCFVSGLMGACTSHDSPTTANFADNVGLVDIGEYAIHLDCRGGSRPTVVVDGGAGTWSTHYRHIQAALTGEMRVCLYDRAGLGQSGVGPSPRDSNRMAYELHEALGRSGETPPFILAGHSLGGYNVRVYQERYPDEVAGLVLIDSAHERQWQVLPVELQELVSGAPAMLREMATFAESGGLTGEIAESQVPPGYPPDIRSSLVQAGSTPKPYAGAAAEFEAVFDSARQVPGVSLGHLPLVVLTAKKSAYAYEATGIPVGDANDAWLALQNELPGLSRNSVQLFSEGTHALNETHPDDIVRAIRKSVELVKDGQQQSP